MNFNLIIAGHLLGTLTRNRLKALHLCFPFQSCENDRRNPITVFTEIVPLGNYNFKGQKYVGNYLGGGELIFRA